MIKEIDDNEYKRLSKLYNTEYFTNVEIMSIKSILIPSRLQYCEITSGNIFSRKFKKESKNHINTIYIDENSNEPILVNKREDEWFLVVNFNYHDDYKRENYLIDGFDNLIYFIKDRKNINND